MNTYCLYVACLQIVECRRVLKWTYAYGYYLPEHEHAKKQFFEYLQGIWVYCFECLRIRCRIVLVICCGLDTSVTILSSGEAESGLERLHQCAEKELQQYLNPENKPPNNFNDFRTKLAGLTRCIFCAKYC